MTKSFANIISSIAYSVLSMLLLFSCNDSSQYSLKKNEISFNEHVRPILNSKCIGCHGGVKKSGGLSFMFREAALSKVKSGNFAIVPGDIEHSEIIHRITSDDPNFRMPLNQEPLTKDEITILKKWIKQGAKWQDHWSFEKPKEVTLPKVKNEKWVQNPIDDFILAKLEQEGLSPSKEADKINLIRRVSLDLIGLPPTIDEIENFVNDDSTDSYSKLVDRLLASKHYGERWTAMWMDLARYADSKGYEKDGHREMWKYRDWLIDAFNNNKKFDEFTIEQLAGDLLPEPTPENLIATAFHRNTMNNDEGGTIDEEYRMAAVIDRVNTTWDVWQGTTFSCVQCHSHPYDPFQHKEYYEFLSFFNNTEDADRPSEQPNLTVFTKDEEAKLKKLDFTIDSLQQYASNKNAIKQLKAEKDSIEASTLPIMRELEGGKRRETHVFLKGNRLDLGEQVQSNVPKLLNVLPDTIQNNRLDMAKWIVSDTNPLTSRVTVNRFWSQLFGRGIVETEEDFGSQGFKPTHPELLDWLALEFQQELEWDVKALLKLIVTSATYKQSSKVSRELQEKDPKNYLLARGARVRLSAEQIRDQTLHVSGLLSDKMYGKSVMPYQPVGVWQTVYSGAKWIISDGEDAYRRALYTYWRRTSPYPSMISFDSPSREVCIMRRLPTNTPLQALVTLNDPVYIEAANALAKIMDQENTIEEKIDKGYQRALSVKPEKQQITVLKTLYDAAQSHIDSLNQLPIHKEVATDSILKDEYATIDERAIEMANLKLDTPSAYVANAILNLNEFTTKQ